MKRLEFMRQSQEQVVYLETGDEPGLVTIRCNCVLIMYQRWFHSF